MSETLVPVVTADQLELIKRTVAKDATPDELKLYLYDCARQGVHPLDRLIHYSKRGGKYTPITSIDFMRIRASESGAYAGSEDAVFVGTLDQARDFSAKVTVWRMVEGQRCPFTATARWTEYKPDQDFMWRKMPHTMLGKCAEALALRKGFPKQLAGLYAKEEMEQAGNTPPSQPTISPRVAQALDVIAGGGEDTLAPSQPVLQPATNGANNLVTDARRVKDVRCFGREKNNFAVTLVGDPLEYVTRNAQMAMEIERFKQTDHLVEITYYDKDWDDPKTGKTKTYHNITSFDEVIEIASDAPPVHSILDEDPSPF